MVIHPTSKLYLGFVGLSFRMPREEGYGDERTDARWIRPRAADFDRVVSF
jgi:hypothetical protein